MKNLVGITVLLLSLQLSSQCFIYGKSTIFVGNTESYSVDEIAQCKNCYLWKMDNNNVAEFSTENKTNSISLKGQKMGRVNLSATLLTNEGEVQCSKTIDVIEANTMLGNSSSVALSNCDVGIDDFKELKYSDNQIAFMPNISQKTFNYQWIMKYQSGIEKRIDEKLAIVENSESDPIVEVLLIVNSTVCTRKFSKSYPESYWIAIK